MGKRVEKSGQGVLAFGRGKHGGKRERAGRKKRSRLVHHAKRPEFARDAVIHVTIGFREGLVNLRRKKEAKAIWTAVAEFRKHGEITEEEFRLLHLSIQRDHLHLGVEAMSRVKLSSAIQRLEQRVQNALKKLWRLGGTIYTGRYHLRVVESPTAVRRLFSYVLGNGRHHGAWKEASTDPFSTASWFEGWHPRTKLTPPCEPESIVSQARSWLATTGWRQGGRKGPLHYSEVTLPNASFV